VARPHGLRGQVIVNVDTDFVEERFAPGTTLWILRDGAPVSLVIRDAFMNQGRPVLTLDGIDSMDAAEALHGAELRVPAEALRTLPAGTYYHHDLIGCTAATVDGRTVGVVRAVEGGSGAERLVIGHGRGEVQLPLSAPIWVEIDVAGRRIVIDPPHGLLDVNA
jgi:16S rRNA processing protein RimM